MKIEQTVLDVFALQVAKYPDQNLLCFENHWLSYSEIDKMSAAVCGQLRSLGITKGDRVGVFVKRSLELPCTILGILKSGAICVPLDSAYPVEQLKEMINKTLLSIILASPDLQVEAEKLGTKTHLADFNHQPEVHIKLEPEDGAYVLFTSGITGSANAVLKSHLSIIKPLLAWLNEDTNYVNGSRMLLRSPLTHSPFIWELFYPIVAGIELIISPEDGLNDTRHLANLIKHYQISHVCLSPAHIRALTDSLAFKELPSLIEVDCSGEVLSSDLIKKFKSQTNALLMTTYGCTEAPSAAIHYCVETDNDEINYIGKPNLNVEFYLLDSDMNKVPDGETGEIYLKGNNLAAGYWNDLVETKKHFIQLKAGVYNNSSQEILFKTGDIGRKLSSGEYEFIGRVDRQFQIRGFRVEPQEIEFHINLHINIRESLVLSCKLYKRSSLLVGYIILNENTDVIDNLNLRNFLLKSLPAHKVPTLFISLKEFPRNQHNKIDYNSLIEPQAFIDSRKKINHVELTITEQKIVEIWSDLLNIFPIFAADDFFLIGGDSLAGINMLIEIEKSFKCDINLDMLTHISTVREIAEFLDKRIRTEGYKLNHVINKSMTDSESFFMLHGGLFINSFKEYFALSLPIYDLRHIDQDGQGNSMKSVEEIAAFYIYEMKAVQPAGPYYIGAYCSGCVFALEIADQLLQSGDSVHEMFLVEPALSLRNGSKQDSNLKKHFNEIITLSLKEKFNYFRRSLNLKIRLISLYRRIIIKIFLKMNRKLPISLRPEYIESFVYLKAFMKYNIKPYSGKINIILAEKGFHSEPDMFDLLSEDIIDYHFIKGANHTNILTHQFSHQWIPIIKSRLSRSIKSL